MSHTVVNTHATTTTSTNVEFFNLGYTRSLQGLLKIAQLVALLIAFICVQGTGYTSFYTSLQFFVVVTLWFLIAFLIFYLMYMFRLQNMIPCINWTITEFLHYAVGTILVFIASIVVALNSYSLSQLVAGSVFGFIATFLMAVSLWTSYKVSFGSQPTSAAV
ncbi:hypothetical protein DPEC_G00141250 [Dallia pectoralis]|uniref:Uncharacterized protein n=1 Tax=Dallia pectoralis TaxID=75939 RepID=A0ACC2GMS3_DALPE|nr:hypothetical protein DPEC_G00141250 [Dallia pectoralis]